MDSLARLVVRQNGVRAFEHLGRRPPFERRICAAARGNRAAHVPNRNHAGNRSVQRIYGSANRLVNPPRFRAVCLSNLLFGQRPNLPSRVLNRVFERNVHLLGAERRANLLERPVQFARVDG